MRSFVAVLAGLLLLLGAACSPRTAQHPVTTGAIEPAASIGTAGVIETTDTIETALATVPFEYRLGPNDRIRVIVFGEEGLSGEFSVDDAGEVSLPLIGEIRARGLTPREFEDAVVAAYRGGYLNNPSVSVEVLNYRPFYILGEVQSPGEYPYRNGLNVLGAIASAKGFTYRANRSAVFIDRPGATQRLKVPASVNEPVQPGDVITVRERFF